jgi:hypothetical protein
LSSSGAPRKIEGIVSRKVWVIAMAVMVMQMRSSGAWWPITGASSRRIADTRLICTPGRRPVIIPSRIPRTNATKIRMGNHSTTSTSEAE